MFSDTNVTIFRIFQFESFPYRVCIRTLDPNKDLREYFSFMRNKVDILMNQLFQLVIFDLKYGFCIGNVKFEAITLSDN